MHRIAQLAAIAMALPLATLQVGCANSGGSLGVSGDPAAISINSPQRNATETGVRKIIQDVAPAKFSNLTARKGKDDEGVHVCGHVHYPDRVTAKTVEQPFYIELRETNGVPNAERGQVGTDPASLAKVKFMCRNHKS